MRNVSTFILSPIPSFSMCYFVGKMPSMLRQMGNSSIWFLYSSKDSVTWLLLNWKDLQGENWDKSNICSIYFLLQLYAFLIFPPLFCLLWKYFGKNYHKIICWHALMSGDNILCLWKPCAAESSSGSRGGGRGGHGPPGPVKISHNKDGCWRLPHRFHVSRPLPYLAAGSATGVSSVSDSYIAGYARIRFEPVHCYQPSTKKVNGSEATSGGSRFSQGCANSRGRRVNVLFRNIFVKKLHENERIRTKRPWDPIGSTIVTLIQTYWYVVTRKPPHKSDPNLSRVKLKC